jgi:hypothetical protein
MNNKRLETKKTYMRRKTLKMNKWNSKLQGVIKKLTSTLNNGKTTTIILHKSTSIRTISTFIKIKQKQEWEIGFELKDWELRMAILVFKHSKKLCTPIAFLDS